MGRCIIEALEPRQLLSGSLSAAAAVTPVRLETLTPVSAVSGWGPIEAGRSNGEKLAGDGKTITLNGRQYAGGLGMHANADVVYSLGGAYDTFLTDMGIDDEVGANGTVVFQVWVDGTKRFDSGKMTGASASQSAVIDVRGAQQLRLVVTDAGDNFYWDHADWAGARLVPPDSAPPANVKYISDLTPVSAQGGWGPVERDQSNGEKNANDGRPLTLNGAVFAKGLGVHARSDVVYDLAGQYTDFQASVGIDDEIGAKGTVVFQVFADGQKVFDSGLMTGNSPTQQVKVDVTGKQQLWLTVTDGGDNYFYDHADWADAKLLVNANPPPPPPTPVGDNPIYLSELTPVSATNGWGPIERDQDNGEQGQNDGRAIIIKQMHYEFGLGMNSTADVVYNLGGKYARFMSDVGVDASVGGRGTVVFQVWADGAKLWDSGLMRGGQAAKTVDVDVSGRQQLRLVVTDGGDNYYYDHADWGDARLAAVPVPVPGPGVNVAIDTAALRQRIDGFGAGILWGDGSAATAAYQDMFATDLGATIIRMPVPHDVIRTPTTLGPDLQQNINLMGWDWFTTTTAGALAKGFQQRAGSDFKLMGTVFSPPVWMKTNNHVNSGSLKMDDANVQQFARYLAAYVKGFEQHYGVPFYTISIQNEPRFPEPYPSCYYTAADWVKTIKAVGAEFEKWGITTKLMGPEDVGWVPPDHSSQYAEFLDLIMADPVAKKYVAFWGHHAAAGNGEADERRTNWAMGWQYVKNMGKDVWQTEDGGEQPTWLYTQPWGAQWGAILETMRLHEALVFGNANTWLYWQFVDKNNLTGALTDAVGSVTYKFVAAAHFFKYIRPGAVRVTATPDSSTGLAVSAYRHDANKTLTAVLINRSSQTITTTLTLEGSAKVSSFNTVVRTSPTEKLAAQAAIPVTNGRLTITLPAYSVVTMQGAFTAG